MDLYFDSLFIGLEAIDVELSIGSNFVILGVAYDVHNGRLILTQHKGFAGDLN